MRVCSFCGIENHLNAARCLRCGTELNQLNPCADPAPGFTLGKTFRYHLLSLIAEGRHAAVWLAEDLKLRRRHVILKVLKIPPDRRARGLAAKIMKDLLPLVHPNLDRILDYETGPVCAFVVAEHISGPTLSRVLEIRDSLSEEEALWVIRETCLGLQYLHRKGLCHGRLELTNLMLSLNPDENKGFELPTVATSRSHPHQCVKICDAMIARLAEDLCGVVQVSPGAAWNSENDMTAMGGLLCRLLTGRGISGIYGEPSLPDGTSPRVQRVLDFCVTPDQWNGSEPAGALIRMIEEGQAVLEEAAV